MQDQKVSNSESNMRDETEGPSQRSAAVTLTRERVNCKLNATICQAPIA